MCMETFIIFDNEGKTFDRFTILNKETGEIYGASEDPLSPEGFSKFLGNCAYRQITMYGSGWREKMPGKKIIKSEVDNFIINTKLNPDWIGKPIEFKALPENAKKYILQLNMKKGNISQDYPSLKKIS